MGRLEAVKKTSRLIRKIGKIFQIVFGIFTGILLISVSILLVLRNTLNGMTVVFQTGVDFYNMGYWANKLAGEGLQMHLLYLAYPDYCFRL